MAKKKTTKRKTPTKLPKLALFVACDAVSRDPNTGKLSLYGLFEVIWSDKFPVEYGPFSVIVRLKGGNGQHKISLEITGPDGKTAIEKDPGPLTVKLSGKSHIELSVQVVGLSLKKSGMCTMTLRSGNRQIGDPLEIEVKKRPKKK